MTPIEEFFLPIFAFGREYSKFFVLAFALFIFTLYYKAFRNSRLKKNVCKSCGTIAKPIKVRPGSLFVEIVLWLSFLVPGLIYTGYRSVKKHWACQNCRSKEIIPADSPLASKFIRENSLMPKATEEKEEQSLSNWPPKADVEKSQGKPMSENFKDISFNFTAEKNQSET